MFTLDGWEPGQMHPLAYELSRVDLISAGIAKATQIKKCQDCHMELHLIPCYENDEGSETTYVTWMPIEAHDEGCPNYGGITSR